jgi:hypothetical protein
MSCWKTLLFIVGFSLSFEFPCSSADFPEKSVSGEASKPVALAASSALSSTLSVAPLDTIDINNLDTAKLIARNILSIKRDNKTQLERGIDNIMNDHSQKHHESGDSYFLTDGGERIKALINLVISNADRHNFFTTRSGRDRLAIRKTISEVESLSIFNTKNIGYDERNSLYRDHVILCFDVTGIKSLPDSTKNGIFMTAFPARENFVCK